MNIKYYPPRVCSLSEDKKKLLYYFVHFVLSLQCEQVDTIFRLILILGILLLWT